MKKAMTVFLLSIALGYLFANPLWDEATRVRSSVNVEYTGSSALCDDGSRIFVWSDMSSGSRDIYAQRIDHLGNAVWRQPVVIDSKPGIQEYPVIGRASSGNFVIAWIDYSVNPLGDVYANRISPYGVLLWGDGGIAVTNLDSRKQNIQIIANNLDVVSILWEDQRLDNWNIYGQKLSASGNNHWQAGGQQMTFMPTREFRFQAIPDNNQGFIIAYHYLINNLDRVMVMRYNSSGYMMWTVPLVVHPDMIGSNLQKIIAFDANSYAILCHGIDSAHQIHLMLHRFNNNGEMIWQQPVHIITSISSIQIEQDDLIKAADNSLIISFLKHHGYSSMELRAQKVSPDGSILWQPGGVPVSGIIPNINRHLLATAPDGGSFIAFNTRGNNYYDPMSLYIQHLNNSGANSYTIPGLLLQTPSDAAVPHTISSYGSYAMLTWHGHQNGESGIFCQVLNPSLQPMLEPNGHPIHKGICGIIIDEEFLVLPRTMGAFTLYKDHRFHTPRLYYQIVTHDGSTTLTDDGVMLGEMNDSHSFTAAIDPNDKVAVIWSTKEGNNYLLRAQLIDAMGNMLWGEDGLVLTQNPYPITNPMISYDEGAFYLGWNEWLPDNNPIQYLRTKAQKIQNNAVQWAQNGIIIGSEANSDQVLKCQTGRYYIMSVNDYDDYWITQVKAILLDPDGSVSTGWQPSGVYLNPDSPIQFLLRPKAVKAPDGVYIAWNNMNSNYLYDLRAQKLSPLGINLWQAGGIVIKENVDNNDLNVVYANNSVTFAWLNDSSYDNPVPYITLARYTSTGDQVWEQELVPDQNAFYNRGIGLLAFDNGVYLCTFTKFTMADRHRAFYVYIMPDGIPVGDINGTCISNPFNEAQFLKPVIAGDHAYLAWTENYYRSINLPWKKSHPVGVDRCPHDWDYDFVGLYLQKLDNIPVNLPGDTTAPSLVSLAQNYPNPFNPITNIKYSLDEPGAVSLEIYNIKGQLVKTLFHGNADKGVHSVAWDGIDHSGNPCSSGVYFYKLRTNSRTLVRKMLMLK